LCMLGLVSSIEQPLPTSARSRVVPACLFGHQNRTVRAAFVMASVAAVRCVSILITIQVLSQCVRQLLGEKFVRHGMVSGPPNRSPGLVSD
jgi:hypothetical protein